MTLSQFAVACGAEPKWVQNTARLLHRRLAYTVDEARRLGLVHQLQLALGLPLERAAPLADQVLRAGSKTKGEVTVEAGVVRVIVDVDRYLSDFSGRLARARVQYAPRRRGRPSAVVGRVARARDYGLDIGLLRSSLELSAEQRIRRLDENMEFVRHLRERAS
jgi:hypothetical protein